MPYSTPDARAARPAFSGHPATTLRSAATRAGGIDPCVADTAPDGVWSAQPRATAGSRAGGPVARSGVRSVSGSVASSAGALRIVAAAMSVAALIACLVAGAPAVAKTAPKPMFDGSAVAVPAKIRMATIVSNRLRPNFKGA